MIVAALWRYPVKAMLGQRLDAVRLDAGGVAGDRRWVLADRRTDERIANKNGPTHPALRACRAELLEAPDGAETLRVTLPGGRSVLDADIAPALSELLGRPIGLLRWRDPAPGRLGAPAGFHDFAPVHLLTTRTLAHLRELRPGHDWDERRFRPNVVLDDGDEPGAFTEDALLGARLGLGDQARLTVGVPTPRCVVPTRAHEELPAVPELLREAVELHSMDLGVLGGEGCVGAYAEVDAPGRVALGDAVRTLERPEGAPAAALAAALARIRERLGV